jgi:hypothetical protein
MEDSAIIQQYRDGYLSIRDDPKEHIFNTPWLYDKDMFTSKIFKTLDTEAAEATPIRELQDQRASCCYQIRLQLSPCVFLRVSSIHSRDFHCVEKDRSTLSRQHIAASACDVRDRPERKHRRFSLFFRHRPFALFS